MIAIRNIMTKHDSKGAETIGQIPPGEISDAPVVKRFVANTRIRDITVLVRALLRNSPLRFNDGRPREPWGDPFHRALP